MDDKMKETLERTRCALHGHLVDLMDEIDQAGGRISSRELLGGVHEALEGLSWVDALSGAQKAGTRSA